MSESESDVNEQVGDTDLVETRRRLEVTLSRTLNGTTDEAEIGGDGTRATGNLLSVLNSFRREKVAIPLLSGVLRSNDLFEEIQSSIQSCLREETTGFRENAPNVRLNVTRERTEELVDDVDQPSLRNPTAYLSLSLSAVGGAVQLSTVPKTGQYSTAKGHQRIYDDRFETIRSDTNE